MATAIADSLTAGRTLRASVPAAATSLDGPPAVELARLGAELDLGAPTGGRDRGLAAADALGPGRLLRRRRCSASGSRGGDLAGLLRRFAAGAAERDRVAEDARAATAQARFTGLLVVAMPSGGALFAELLAAGVPAQGAALARPRRSCSASPRRLQVVGFVAIRRFSKVAE